MTLLISGYEITYLLFYLTLAQCAWEIFLQSRQYMTALYHPELPQEQYIPEYENISPEAYKKSRLLQLWSRKLGVIKIIVHTILQVCKLSTNVLSKLWEFCGDVEKGHYIQISCWWIYYYSTIHYIIGFFFDIIRFFFIEKEFGFTSNTFKTFLEFHLQNYIIEILMKIFLTIASIQGILFDPEYFFIWLWLIIAFILTFLFVIYPYCVAKFILNGKILPAGELRDSIKAFALEIDFPLQEIYIVDNSVTTKHLCVDIIGFFHYQLLLNKELLIKNNEFSLSKEEIIALIGHQIGHHTYNHKMQKLIIWQLHFFIFFVIFPDIFSFPIFFSNFGFGNTTPIIVKIVIMYEFLMVQYTTISRILINYSLRRFESQADYFVAYLNKGPSLFNALTKLLYIKHLIFPVYDDLFVFWYHVLPTRSYRGRVLLTKDIRGNSSLYVQRQSLIHR